MGHAELSASLKTLCPQGGTVWELLQAVSRSGDTRFVRLFVVRPYEPATKVLGLPERTIEEITQEAAKVCDRAAKDGRFKLYRGEPDGYSVQLLASSLYGSPEALTGTIL